MIYDVNLGFCFFPPKIFSTVHLNIYDGFMNPLVSLVRFFKRPGHSPGHGDLQQYPPFTPPYHHLPLHLLLPPTPSPGSLNYRQNPRVPLRLPLHTHHHPKPLLSPPLQHHLPPLPRLLIPYHHQRLPPPHNPQITARQRNNRL